MLNDGVFLALAVALSLVLRLAGMRLPKRLGTLVSFPIWEVEENLEAFPRLTSFVVYLVAFSHKGSRGCVAFWPSLRTKIPGDAGSMPHSILRCWLQEIPTACADDLRRTS